MVGTCTSGPTAACCDALYFEFYLRIKKVTTANCKVNIKKNMLLSLWHVLHSHDNCVFFFQIN